MAASKLLYILAISTLAILSCSFGFTPVNALVTGKQHLARSPHGHDAIAKRKRSTVQRRCQSQPPPSAAAAAAASPSATTAATTTPTDPTTTTTAQPAATSPPASGGGAPPAAGGGKVGLAWPNGDDPSLQYYITDQVQYLYTWSPDIPQEAINYGLTVAPMLWGYNQIDDFQTLVVAGYASYVLGMNEPNEPGQSNMDAGSGAQLWQQYIQPLKSQGYTLISPATSSNPNGLVWMTDFFAACQGCTVDIIAVHWYDVDPQDFINYVTNWYNTFGLPIWVTEFACQNYNGGPQCTQDQVNNFMSTVTSWMNSTPWVEAYFAFGVMLDMQGVNPDDQLMSPDGTPTQLGYMYINS
jgi:hypothetical protein